MDKPIATEQKQKIESWISKEELMDAISNVTYENKQFRKEAWSMFDAEQLIRAGNFIKSKLEKQ